jgi:hypothetical protein
MNNNTGNPKHLVPSLSQFDEVELISSLSKADKRTMRKIQDFSYTVSYHIFAELHKLATKGNRAAINTLQWDGVTNQNYFKFKLILAILDKHNKGIQKQEEQQQEQKQERKIFTVRYYLDEEGSPVLLDPFEGKETKLNLNSQTMFG